MDLVTLSSGKSFRSPATTAGYPMAGAAAGAAIGFAVGGAIVGGVGGAIGSGLGNLPPALGPWGPTPGEGSAEMDRLKKLAGSLNGAEGRSSIAEHQRYVDVGGTRVRRRMART